MKSGEPAGINTSLGLGPIKGKTIGQLIKNARRQLGRLDKPFELPNPDMQVEVWTQFVIHVEHDPFPIAWGLLSTDAGGDIGFDLDYSCPDIVVCLDTNVEDYMTDGQNSGATLHAEMVARDELEEESDSLDDDD